ncbi:trifunctional serine/threonine-protein kinase/ATP-binding protein/sensor histidine kinase [Sphingomonas faeni]|uniref:trifunctional serine/threonine-protein kinase/ATP-binding protein/sensor histidine kinase n=1 Tax=Sphingomonas faeni TaxID=185950 RepID=UPI00278A797F|nr:AAA family ATPase [Sphingomonas faeni]MDQ0839286.1 putative ATPase/signal transduction histidine kinase [Sphingomonas faeni]
MSVAPADKPGPDGRSQTSVPATGRLFGRTVEVASITQSYARVKSTGRSEIVLISGPPGIGKSALVHRFRFLLGSDGHRFGAGKSDLLQRNVAFAPLMQLLRPLIDSALGESDAELDRLRNQMRQMIGREAWSVVDLVPEAQALLGRGAILPELPPTLAQARIRRGVVALLGALATPTSPLILFLDDLQWADPSTLALLVALAEEPPRHVLLIIALRDSESASLAEPGGLLEQIRTGDMTVSDLSLRALNVEDTEALLSAAFGEVNDAAGLAQAVHDQTDGNPFFVQQVLQTLREERTSNNGLDESRWDWSRGRFARRREVGDVLDFMAIRIGRLEQGEIDLLGALALLDGRSEVPLLATITGMDVSSARERMESLIKAGFVVEVGGGYAFAHDHIHATALSLTPYEERAAKHAWIATLLLKSDCTSSPEQAFEVAGHIVQAIGKQPTDCSIDVGWLSSEDRKAFAMLLHAAVAFAEKAAAVDQVVEYVNSALSLASSDWWEACYPLMFSLHFARCEQMLLRGQIDVADREIDMLIERASNEYDRAGCYRLRAGLRTVQSDYNGAIDAALEGLALLGHPLSRYPSLDQCREACERVQSLMGNRPTADILKLRLAEDPTTGLITSLLSGLFAAIFSDDGLRILHAAAIIELTLKDGVTADSAHGLAWFGVFIADMYDRYEDGFAFAQAALALVDLHGFEGQRTAVLIAVDQLSPWTQPLDYALATARDAIAAGSAAGDLGMTCYARNHLVSDLILSGERLAVVEDEADRGLALTRRIDFRDIEILIAAQRSFVRRLSVGEVAERYEELGEITSASTRFWVRLYDGIAAYMFEDTPRAAAVFGEAAQLTWAVPANIDLAYFELFAALNAARFHPAEDALAAMRPHRARLAGWAARNPATFANKLSLVDAEIARLRGDELSAMRTFDRAVDQSSAFVHERALARELAGRHAADLELDGAAASYLADACADYRTWGAFEKAQWVERRHPGLAARRRDRTDEPDVFVPAALVAIARDFSQELRFVPLVEKLIRSTAKQASADSAMLILLRDGDPVVAASGYLEGDEMSVVVDTTIPTADRLPSAVLKEALEARTVCLLQDSAGFQEPVREKAVHATLCLPLVKGDLRIGAILLFRRAGGQGFGGCDIDGLELLAAQAAISLESARTYTDVANSLKYHSDAAASLRVARSELARTSHLSVMGGLAASIAHEINQPLASVLALSDAARRWLRRKEPDLTETLACVDGIHGAGVRASEIVRSLRSLAKQESPALLPVSLNAVVRHGIELIGPEMDAHQIQLACRFDAGEDVTVPGDRVQLQQVLHNLLTNAIDAVENRSATSRHVAVSTFDSGTAIAVRVEDNGCGIPPEKLKEILTPLFTTKTKGMGMGLAICNSIIEAHGGTLTATHVETGGTVFEFAIPR